MAYTFYAEDTEFGVATGDNVGAGDGVSTFDGRPAETTDLVVTSHADDTDPRLFEVGETYTLSFSGPGGTTLNDAVVVRSDVLDGNQGVIVFEGTNPAGQTVQVAWAPNVDVEGWYEAGIDEGATMGFYNTDQSAGDYRFACFAQGTEIRTPGGSTPVEALRQGDAVLTRDHGAQPVLWHSASTVPGIGRAAPVTIARDVFGGDAALTLSAQHRVLVRSPAAALAFWAGDVLVPVKALVDGQRITRCSAGRMRYHHLLFERHEIICANGVWCESLLLGDFLPETIGPAAQADFEAMFGGPMPRQPVMPAARPILRAKEAAVLRAGLGLGARDIGNPAPPGLFRAAPGHAPPGYSHQRSIRAISASDQPK